MKMYDIKKLYDMEQIKTNAIDNREHPDYPPDIYDVKYELSNVLAHGRSDPDDDDKDSFGKHGYLTVGYGDISNVKFYTIELYLALIDGYFCRLDYETNCFKVDRIEFLHCYCDAFKDGRLEFDNKISKSGINGTQELVTYLIGWLNKCKFILQNPDFLTYHLIKEYGRYAGVFSRIIELIGDDRRLQPHIKELADNNPNLLQQIKLVCDDPNLSLKQEPKLKTKYNADTETETYKLTKLYNDAVNNKLIRADLDSWLYWFAGEPCDNPLKIQWEYRKNEQRGSIAALLYFMQKLLGDNYKDKGKRRLKEIGDIFNLKIESAIIETSNQKTKRLINNLF